MAVEALDFSISASEQMKQQAERRPRIVWAAVLSIEIVGEKHRFHFLGFVVAIEKIAEAAGEK